MTEAGVTDKGEAEDSAPAGSATPDGATPDSATAGSEATDSEAQPRPHEPSEITFAEQFYPARPRHLRPKARLRGAQVPTAEQLGEPIGSNPSYVNWLRQESMLNDANVIARQFVGRGSMFQNPFARPNPSSAIETASVWFTAYPISVIGKPGRSFLATLGDPELWKAFQRIGIQGLHTGPVKRAGGIRGWNPTPSVDGHFDRISTQIDPAFGTEAEFRTMCEVAGEHDGTIIDDIVPGHTGKGADFRLAEMKVTNYPGIYHMVEIDPADWHLLPDVPAGRDSTNIDVETEDQLAKYGYIVGKLQRVIFHQPGVKDTNWSTTAAVLGPDGVTRRWVYLHYFKQGQPSINWLDPTFAGVRMVIGDALHSLTDLGSGALRLDANGFLGVEKSAVGLPAWSEGHPLSEAANQLIASMVRKVGGFTFQELNLTIDDIKITSESGADLSYDFINRPAYQHALAMGDSEFLRLTLNASMTLGVEPIQLVHALQNHDELTYELVHFTTLHKDDVYSYHGIDITGADLAVKIRGDLTDRLTGDAAPYNLIFSTNGIASTTGTVIAAALGYTSIENLTDDQIRRIRQAHLLLAMFNALQPGVFSLSGWDLLGMLTLDPDRIRPLLATGDTRWIHRSAYDLMGFDPEPDKPRTGMPKAVSMYGPLPEQLKDEASFVSQLQRILTLRERYGIATSRQVDVPGVANKAMLVMVHQLSNPVEHQVTVLNFGTDAIVGTINSVHLDPGSVVVDMYTDEVVGEVDDLHSFSLALDGHQGRSLFISPAEKAEPEPVSVTTATEGDGR